MSAITVLMSVYNETEAQLRAAIESILQQTEADFEMQIVLDQPNASDLLAILNEYQDLDPRVHVLVNKQNSGLPFSLNRGIEAASGDYLARMDADDIAKPQRFATQLHLMQQRRLDVLSTNAHFIDENGKSVGNHNAIPESSKALAELLPYGSNLIHPSVMMKTASIKAVGGYRLLPTAEDYDLWLRLLKAGYKIGATNARLMDYRLRGNSMTQGDRYKVFLVSEYLQQTFAAGDFPDADTELKQLQAYLDQNQLSNKQRAAQFTRRVKMLSAGKTALRERKPLRAVSLVSRALVDPAVRRYAKQSQAYSKVYARLIEAVVPATGIENDNQ
ncbi:glycosyltransferase [Lacticaseibacillus zhaodongensis]|uniref:glycosyltransferase n=1 Tax=Lacticaseibacillus zhaodongensis TaxID=2668065 RepID=UPI0012D33230|nr:glycosyltransferase [Lacticaseibacillus zhaodongensis]